MGKASFLANADVNADGGDEELTAVFDISTYYAIVVYKHDSYDWGRANTFRLLIGEDALTGAPAPGTIPTAFALGESRPNPFNPHTEIGYDVPAGGGEVTLGVYNVSGQLVRRLVAGQQQAGRHTVAWDGRDAAGLDVSSGVYFVRFEAAGVRQTSKITLLR
jgi:hypothetical protein